MAMTQTNGTGTDLKQAGRNAVRMGGLMRDGVVGLWGRLRYRDPAEFDAWMQERDLTIITATLMRLSERQLDRLGMSRRTLALDVEDLARNAHRRRVIGHEVLRLLEDLKTHEDKIAAE